MMGDGSPDRVEGLRVLQEFLEFLGEREFKKVLGLEDNRFRDLMGGVEEVTREQVDAARARLSIVSGVSGPVLGGAAGPGGTEDGEGDEEGYGGPHGEARGEEDEEDLVPGDFEFNGDPSPGFESPGEESWPAGEGVLGGMPVGYGEGLGVRGTELSGEEWVDEEDEPEGVVLAGQVTRSMTPADETEQRKRSLFNARDMAMMTQFRVGTQYQESVAAIGLVAQIELVLICFFRESVPEPGVLWDADRRSREMSKRLARLRWVEREQEREFTGFRGVLNWLAGRTRLTGKDLYQKMVVEADDMMEAIALANASRARRGRVTSRALPGESGPVRTDDLRESLEYADLDYLIEGSANWGNVVEGS